MFTIAQGPRSTTTDLVVMIAAMAFCTVVAFAVVVWWRRFDRTQSSTELRPDGFENIYQLAKRNAVDIAGSNAELRNPPVSIVFHTYTRKGVIGVKQDVHRCTLPAFEALELVKLLHNYNLQGCLVPYKGVVYVPLLSYLEARRLRRMINKMMWNPLMHQ